MNIASQVGTAAATSDGGKANEHGGLLALASEEGSGGDVGEIAIRGEDTVSTGTTGVDSTFGDLLRSVSMFSGRSIKCATYPLMVKSLDLLTEDEVLEQSRTTLSNAQTVLVGDGTTDISGEVGVGVVEVVVGEEVFRVGGSIVSGIARVKFTGHVRAGGTGDANEAGNQKGTHLDRTHSRAV